jgi:hypothetical protein
MKCNLQYFYGKAKQTLKKYSTVIIKNDQEYLIFLYFDNVEFINYNIMQIEHLYSRIYTKNGQDLYQHIA